MTPFESPTTFPSGSAKKARVRPNSGTSVGNHGLASKLLRPGQIGSRILPLDVKGHVGRASMVGEPDDAADPVLRRLDHAESGALRPLLHGSPSGLPGWRLRTPWFC